MNGYPTAAQDRFQNIHQRQLGCVKTGSPNVVIHHIIGARWNGKGLKKLKCGEWFTIPVHPDLHTDIHNHKYDFFQEREWWLECLANYELVFNEPHPVPEVLVRYINDMKNGKDIPRGFYAHD